MSWKKLIALLAVLAMFAAACGSDDGGDGTSTDATTDAPATTADDGGGGDDDEPAETTTAAPAPEGTMAGEGGDLLLLQWQAPSQANGLLSNGTKDLLASSIVLEPLAEVTPDGELVPTLATEIPTEANGGISADKTSITWSLRDDVLWSDGTQFTASDVVFSYNYCIDEATGCSVETFSEVTSVVADDDFTVTLTFEAPKPYPFEPFVGYNGGVILQEAQMAECIGAAAQSCSEQNFAPVGTGPYIVTDLRPEDTVTYTYNPNYRFAAEGKPFFTNVTIKGGGDAEAAARSVLEVGEADYAWNLQVAPEILAPMEATGIGRLVSGFTANVEHISLNQTDPFADPPSEGTPNPLFVDNPDLHRALSISINRDELVAVGYGPAGRPTCNIWPVGAQSSTNNDWCLTQDIAAANELLDGLGYLDSDGDGVREADGYGPLEFDYVTSTNAVRQSNQELVAAYWDEIGVKANMKNEDASLFFDGTCASDACIWKFFTPMQMYTNGASSPYVGAYMNGFTTEKIPTSATSWGGDNIYRIDSEEVNTLTDEMLTTALDDPRLTEVAIEINDLVSTSAIIPLIHRANASAWSNQIEGTGDLNGWDSEYWNIEDWFRSE
ncbi:MAG: peptide ABC transporter substrate-binding protein [Acidimicrobiales bacterium]